MKNRKIFFVLVGGIALLLLIAAALKVKAQTGEVVNLPFVLKGYPLPQSGQVVFVSSRDGDPEIFRMDYDGGNVTQLSINTSDDLSPDWSPDGSQIAFVSDRSGQSEIYVMDADGTDPLQLTTMGNCGSPQWSPDGTRIAFYTMQDTNSVIYTMDPDGSNFDQITASDISRWNPYWSPDGTRIAYITLLEDPPGVYAIDADGTDPVLLFEYEIIAGMAWSPDGRWLALDLMVEPSYTYDVFLYDLENENLTRLTTTTINHFDIDWFPLGMYLIFHSLQDDPATAEIYTMTQTGLLLQNITNSPGGDYTADWTP